MDDQTKNLSTGGNVAGGAGSVPAGGAPGAGEMAGVQPVMGGAGMADGGGSLNTIVPPPEAEPVVIASAPDKPKLFANRRLVLGVILGVLVLIIGAVAFVWFRNGGGNTATQSNTVVKEANIEKADNYRDAFLLYANYALTGVASIDPLPSMYDATEDYPIQDAYEKGNANFIKIAEDYLNSFKAIYQSATTLNMARDNDSDDPLVGKVEAPADDLNIIDIYFEQFETAKNVDYKVAADSSEEDAYNAFAKIYYAQQAVVENIWQVWEVLNDEEN